MANTKFPRKEVEKQIKLTDENIDKIMMLGIPVESLSADEIEIQVLPNRPDLLSLQGFLRAISSSLTRSSPVKYKIKPSGEKILVDKAVEKVRPYSMAAIVKGVKFTDERIKEIMQWQEKIHATIGRNRKKVALGYYDLKKIKFPVKYITKSPKDIVFEPLDMPEKMTALQILSRHPCGRDYGFQLEAFDKYSVYYDSNGEVLSLPPIINSNNSGKIVPGVSDVLIECSGTDLETLKKVISMAVVDLIDLGGKAFSVDVHYGSRIEKVDLKPETIKISLENTNKLLGLSLKEKDLEKLLPKMGFEYKAGKVLIPAWRTDILHEVDIIEDIAIAYGYDNLVPEIPKVATIGSESKESKIISKISEILSGLGLLEISSYHLIKEEESKIFKLDERQKITILDSKTNYKMLRPNLLIPTLRVLSENKDHEYPQKIFEIGSVFKKDERSETGIREPLNLIVALTPGNFTEIKQALDYLAKMLNINFHLKEHTHQNLIEGRSGTILLGGKEIGYIGEVSPETINAWNLKLPISVLELNLDEIITRIQ